MGAVFPERQIYIRSNGRVRFYTLTPLAQATVAGVALTFFGWVGFTSANVIFKDRMIAGAEEHNQQIQASYESRIADLQVSYDELNSALVAAEDHFTAIASDLEAKHRTIASLLDRKESLRNSLGIGAAPRIAMAADPAISLPGRAMAAGGEDVPLLGDMQPPASASPEPLLEGSPLSRQAMDEKPSIIPQPAKAEPPRRQTFIRGAVNRLEALFRRRVSDSSVNHPVLRKIAALDGRLAEVSAGQPALLATAEQSVRDETARLQRAARRTGMNIPALLARVDGTGAAGGPFIPVQAAPVSRDGMFNERAARAEGALDELTSLVALLHAMPLARPVAGGSFELTSGFGTRRDPFTGRIAFHSGLDFSGPAGAPVRATAPGVVAFAGQNGAYGNTVEIDHGLGVRTRYGHLSAITVAEGTKIALGAPVGRLGSTGRSTGPHVHYEVWYDNAVRNPGSFIKAGQHVLQE